MGNNKFDKQQLKKYIEEYKAIRSQIGEMNETYPLASWEKKRMENMTKEQFSEYLSKMWSIGGYRSNPEKKLNQLLDKNGQDFEKIKQSILELLYGNGKVEERWKIFNLNGLKESFKSEFLSYANPDEYIICNDLTKECLKFLGINDIGKTITGEEYLKICNWAKEIKKQMKEEQIDDANMLTVNDLFFYIIKSKITGKGEILIKEKQRNNKKDNNISENIEYGNFIYYGAPGCGKSHNVQKIVEKFNGGYERILFHEEYDYSDFVGQILPTVKENKSITYEFKPGPFTKMLGNALANKDKHYCLLIEEINRGNAAAIFGDIFQLMDRRKKDNPTNKDENGFRVGDSEYDINNDLILNWLLDSEQNNKRLEKIKSNMRKDNKIYIPHNMSIYATMNSSDQNVFVLDTAFKRRWKLRYVPIDLQKIDENLMIPVENNGETVSWKKFLEVLNDMIPELNNGINGEDKLIGQYFVSKEELENVEDFAHKIFLYLWNDVAKVDRTRLFRKTYNHGEKEIKINTLERLVEAYKRIGLKVFDDEIREKMLK